MERVAFKVVIPARMHSTRLPGKMLADVAGKPLVAWAVQRGIESGAAEVIVATDHAQIADAVASLGCRVCITSPEHATGTDRLGEAVDLLGLAADEIVVNVQGDEPLIDPQLIRQVAAELVVMTEKDAVKCAAFADARMWLMRVDAMLPPEFEEFLLARIAQSPRRPHGPQAA